MTAQIKKPTIHDITSSQFFRKSWWIIPFGIFLTSCTVVFLWFIFMSVPDTFGLPWTLGASAILLILLGIILGRFWQKLRQHVDWQQYSTVSGGIHSYDEVPSSRMAYVFQRGVNRCISDKIVNPTSLPFTTIGNYSYWYYFTCNDVQIPFWRRRVSFFSLKLPRQLPHIILDSTSNNFLKKFSEYDIELQGLQRLKLEGDFINYFNLYVPKGYERDAFYIFSPDIMELMINHASSYDIEIIDDTLYLFASGSLDVHDIARLSQLEIIAEAFLAKFNKNVSRYADQTVADKALNIIAPTGRRLTKRTISIVAITCLVYIVLITFQLFI